MRYTSNRLSPASAAADLEWHESSKRKTSPFNTVFSDDEEEDEDEFDPYGMPSSSHATAPRSLLSLIQPSTSQIVADSSTSVNSTMVDPLVNSASYHVHVAEAALSNLKRLAVEDGWKKALRHKSGVVVYMKKEKTPLFKGEAVIQGFSPQSVFYVVGMRKLWDQQYEDGNLIENLNETTSLTYEVTKASATSKPRDFALVERIECAPNGSIIFVSTSVETPRMPRVQGRVRAQIKLQGWILEPIRGPAPATRVTYMIQESMKGWVPGLAKKTLARRPLVIALVNEYLQRKVERMRTEDKIPRQTASNRRPSAMSSIAYQSLDTVASTAMSPSLRSTPTSPPPSTSTLRIPSPNQRPILVYTNEGQGDAKQRRITFADRNTNYPASAMPESPVDADFYLADPIRLPVEEPARASTRHPTTPPPTPSPRHPPTHRHTSKKVACMQALKRLTATMDNESPWKLCSEHEGVRTYSNGEFFRGEMIMQGKWSPEQLCSVVQCFGARPHWDDVFEQGTIVERFSQKDYLVHWVQRNAPNVAAITTIDTDTISGTIYTATTSVEDTRLGGSSEFAWVDLYGWAFATITDKDQRRGTKATLICQRKETMNSMMGVQRYLEQHGCPPYIRRVAGKVTDESFDSETRTYRITLTAKYEPSNAYRARKKAALQWYTDIRFSQIMYPDGLQVTITPTAGTKVVLAPENTHLKIYTDTETMNGKSITLDLTPAVRTDTDARPSYTCNGHALDVPQPVRELPPTPTAKTHPKVSDTESSPTARSTQEETAETALQLLPPSPAPTTTASSSSSERTSSPTPSSPTLSPAMPENTLRVPKGYVLVPQHQVNKQHILILSDELSFNGQQLAVAFIAMMLCYCMGKFACSSCTSLH